MELKDIVTNSDGTKWTRKTPTMLFRVDLGEWRLYRREESKYRFFGGYEDKSVSLDNEQLVREWLA